jgi:CRP-like cAMP-binding protein
VSKLLRQFEVNIGDGEYVFREGDFGDSLFMLQSGKVKLIQKLGANKKLLKIVESGNFFGETDLNNPQNRVFSALAVGNCTLLKIDQNSFAKLIRNDINFASNYIAYLSGYLQDTNNKIDYLNKKYEKQKIYSTLMKDLLLNGKKDISGNWILVDLNRFISNNIGNLDRKEIMSVIDKMSKAGIIHIKIDKAKNLWIGVSCRGSKSHP